MLSRERGCRGRSRDLGRIGDDVDEFQTRGKRGETDRCSGRRNDFPFLPKLKPLPAGPPSLVFPPSKGLEKRVGPSITAKVYRKPGYVLGVPHEV